MQAVVSAAADVNSNAAHRARDTENGEPLSSTNPSASVTSRSSTLVSFLSPPSRSMMSDLVRRTWIKCI
jgi:hypothetical protein